MNGSLVQHTSLLQRQLQRLPQLHIQPLQPLHLPPLHLPQLLILRLQLSQPHMHHLHLPRHQFTPRRIRLSRPTNHPTHQHPNIMLTITLPYEISRALNFTLKCRFYRIRIKRHTHEPRTLPFHTLRSIFYLYKI